jgi:glutamate--cysteine ligase
VVAVEARPSGALRTVDEALEHVRAICFKTGPPRLLGAELEWIVQHVDDPRRPLAAPTLAAALSAHAPRTLTPDSPHLPLPRGGVVTVEPGGQVEISTPPAESGAALRAATDADIHVLAGLLARQGLRLCPHGIDPHRPTRRVLRTPRYDAMANAFARLGVAGGTMMSATAAVQVCLDAGEPDQVPARWETVHDLGPPLVALFATSRRQAGADTGWASARMRASIGVDPARTGPVGSRPDPATAWARYAVAAPLVCVRRPGDSWRAPPGVTFADWVAGRITPPPTVDDLDYHLGTLFPPVRPRGYLEIRYLDAQPPGEWFAPVAVVAALLADDATAGIARELARPVAGAWTAAAREGLTDPALRTAARRLADLACRSLDRVGLPPADQTEVVEIVDRRLAAGDP